MLKHTLALSVLTGLLLTACSDDKGAGQQQSKEQTVKKISKAFAKRDSNKDGKLSRKEFVAFAKARLQSQPLKIDSNKDAVVSLEEFTASKAKMQERLQAEGVKASGISERIAKQYASFDLNKDGSVAAAEFAQRMAVLSFKRKDSDKNNHLTPQEFSAKPGASKAPQT